MALPSIEQFMRDRPGRVVLTIGDIALAISERAAVSLVMANPPAARLCECGAYHLEPAYLVRMISGHLLDVSELNGRDDMTSDEAANLLAKTLSEAPTPHRVEVPAEMLHDTPAPAFVAPQREPIAEPPTSTHSREDIETRHAIRTADWFKRTAAPVVFRMQTWTQQRANSVAGDGYVEDWAYYLVHPHGAIERLVTGEPMPAFTVYIGQVSRLNELRELAPIGALRPRHRVLVALRRFLAGAYLNPTDVSQ